MDNRTLCKELQGKVVTALRLGLAGDGGELMKQFIDALLPLLNENSDLLAEPEVAVINEIMQVQESGDFCYLADIMEYKLLKTNLGKLIGMDSGSV